MPDTIARPNYRSIKDIYDELKDAGVVKNSLPEWSDQMNRITKSDLFEAGLHDNIIKRASVGVDRALEATTLPERFKPLGGAVGELLGNREAGEKVGEKIPRGLLNMASFLIPGAGWANAARLGIAGLMSGAETYTETGSPAAGLISAGTTAAIPAVAGAGERIAARALGAREVAGPIIDAAGKVTKFSQFYPEGFVQKTGTFLGGQIAASGFMEGEKAIESVAKGETPKNPFTVENVLSQTIGQVPFAAIHLTNKAIHGTGPSADTMQHAVDRSQKEIVRQEAAKNKPIEPVVGPQPMTAESQQALAALRGQQLQVDPTNIDEANHLLQAEHEVLKQGFEPTAQSVFGDTIAPDNPRQVLVGREVKSTGKWRAIEVADMPQNPENLRGKIVSYSTSYEPAPNTRSDGTTVFSLPGAQWQTVKTADEWNQRKVKTDPNQPELPDQAKAATDQEIWAHIQDLKKVEIDAEAAQTPAELQQATVRLQGVQHENNIPITNDATLRPMVEQLTKEGDPTPEKTAVKIAAKRTSRLVESTRDKERATPPLTPEETSKITEQMGEGGFQIITADKLSHTGAEESRPKGPWSNIVEEAAFNIAQPEVQKGKAKEVQMFMTLVSHLGTIKEVGPDEISDVSQYISDRDGVSVAEAKSSVEAFLQSPEAAMWGTELDQRVTQRRLDNAAPERTFYHGTNSKALGETEHFSEKQIGTGAGGAWGPGFYFETDKGMAKAYSLGNGGQGGGSGKVIEANLDFKNPFDTTKEIPLEEQARLFAMTDNPAEASRIRGWTSRSETGRETNENHGSSVWQKIVYGMKDHSKKRANELLQKAGYDGLIANDDITGTDHEIHIAFRPEQISILPKTLDNPVPEDVTPFIPTISEDIARVHELGNTGESALAVLGQMDHPLAKLVYESLKDLKDTLKRIDFVVGKTKSGGSFTRDMGNGRATIAITPGHMDSVNWPFILAHELVHGATTIELNNPTNQKVRVELEQLRNRLVEQLPSNLKRAYNKAIEDGWYAKWSTGDTRFEDLYRNGTPNERQLLYGLLNTHEMVAQGLSREPMQNFMRRVSGTGKIGAFKQLVNRVKDLLHIEVTNTAFEDFLGHTEALLQQGDFVASFQDFAERHFENQGLSDSMVQGQTRRALSLVINSGFGTSKEDIFSQLMNDISVRSPEVRQAQKGLLSVLDTSSEHRPQVEQLMGELGHETSVKGFNDFTHESLMGRESKYSDALAMMPQEAKNFIFAKVKDMQSVLDVVKAASADWNNGLLNLADPATLRGPVKAAMAAVEKILDVQKMHEHGRQLAQESMAMMPDTFSERAPHLAPEELDKFGVEDIGKPGWLTKMLGPMSRTVRKFPVTAELADRVYELGPNIANMQSNILRVLGIDPRSGSVALTKTGLDSSVKAISTPQTKRAVDSWMYWNNEIARREERGVTALPISHPEISKLLSKLNPNERQGVIDTVGKQEISTKMKHAEVLEKMHQIGVSLGAKVVMKDTGLKTADSVKIMGQMWDAAIADRTDPQMAQQADAMFESVRSQMTPDGFLQLIKYTQKEMDKFKGWKKYFDANPAWATAQRLERFLVRFSRGKEVKNLQASSMKEAKVISEGGSHVEITDQWKDKEDEFPVLGPDADKWFARAKELESNQLRDLVNGGYLSQEGQDRFNKLLPSTQQERETAANQSGIPRFSAPPRLLSQGADELPWFWNHVAHTERISNFWSRKLLRAQSELHLADPDMTANPEIRSMMQDHVENVLRPDPNLARQISRFTSTWFMGFSPASAMMNGFQTITTAVPELTNINGGRWIDSYQKWGRALADVATHITTGEWRTPDQKWFYQEMSKAHELEFSMYSDEAATQEAASVNFKRMMMKQKPQNIGQYLSTAAGMYTKAGMWMFKSVERQNNKIASLMAFDHYMGEGMTKEDALVEAKRFNRSVNYGGGRANRPVGVYSGAGDVSRTLAMLATNMQGYNLGVISQIGDYLQRGFFRPPGITPAEVYASRKAGLQMMATQLVAAGTLGLPFVSGMLAVLNQFFPQLEAGKKVREWAKDFFQGDSENGNVLGDVALTGLPSMLGWDMQSRLSIGNVVPGVSEYNGFQPETLLGPPANLVKNFVDGVSRVASGDPQGGRNFVPPGLRHLFDGLSALATGEPLKDYRNRPLFGPTFGETAGLALGFQPKKLSDLNAANRILEQNRLVAQKREDQFHQQQAEEVLSGNFGNVRAALQQRAQLDKNFDSRDAVHSIAQAAEDLTFPRDLRREGTLRTSPARSRLLSTFNLPPSSPSEVDRLNLRLGVMGRLGLQTDPRMELYQAQQVDRLQQQNPSATRSELRRQVSEGLRRRPRNAPLLPESQ